MLHGGINLIEHLNRIVNAEYIIRIKNNLWKELKDLPMTDLDTTITINLCTTQTNVDKNKYAECKAKWIAGHGKHRKLLHAIWDFESPYSVTIRIVKFKISEDTYETLATSLPKDLFPSSYLKHLYHLRWGIETSFRELKYAIGVTNFHAKTSSFVLQEIFARIVMYDFCERITLHAIVDNKQNRKWKYQPNYTMGIHICLDFFRHAGDKLKNIEEKIRHYV